MANRWFTIADWAIVVAMFAAGLLAWPFAPERFPLQFGLSGEPTSFGGRLEGLFLLPAVTLGVLVLLKLLPRIDPRGARYAEFARQYAAATLVIVAFLGAVYAIVLAHTFGAPINVSLLIVPLLGVMFIALGALMEQVRQNWFFGIRTPWTLSSERSWSATHRAGRWVLIGIGVALVLAGVLQSAWAIVLAIVLCAAGLLGLVVYSYVVWRDDPERTSARPT